MPLSSPRINAIIALRIHFEAPNASVEALAHVTYTLTKVSFPLQKTFLKSTLNDTACLQRVLPLELTSVYRWPLPSSLPCLPPWTSYDLAKPRGSYSVRHKGPKGTLAVNRSCSTINAKQQGLQSRWGSSTWSCWYRKYPIFYSISLSSYAPDLKFLIFHMNPLINWRTTLSVAPFQPFKVCQSSEHLCGHRYSSQ